jgi:hypothetical protein
MPFLNKKKLPRFVFVTLIMALLTLGLTNCKHLFGGEMRWITFAREMRCVGYQGERVNLRSAENTEDDKPLSDSTWHTANFPFAQIDLTAIHLGLFTGQHDEKVNDLLRNQSPVLNL